MKSRPATTSATTAFERATAVRALGDGRFLGDVDLGWSAPLGPNGGYMAAIIVRALQAGLDPAGERRLRSLTLHYLRRPGEGDIEIEVETARTGRRMSTGRVTASQGGKEMIAGLASFSVPDLAVAGTWVPLPPDVVPAPPREAGVVAADRYRRDADAWLDPAHGIAPIVHRVKLAPRLGRAPFSGREVEPGRAAQTGGWITLPEPQRIDAAYVALLTDIWWPPALEPLSAAAGAPTIDLTIHVRADLPPEGLPDQPVLGHYRSTAAVGGLVEEDGALFLADGTLLAQSRQLALLTPMV